MYILVMCVGKFSFFLILRLMHQRGPEKRRWFSDLETGLSPETVKDTERAD